jgi:NADPH:quinone reductase-like Zn-dependent oxidoreductase
VKAAVRDRYGPPDVVRVVEVDRPAPIGDQVLVRVEAASINRADLDLLYPKPGFTRLFLGLRRPRERRIGCDVAGVVAAVGPAVTRFRPGERVFGDLYPFGLGSLAEFACAPERAFLPIPAALSTEQAATLPHAAVLAVQGLRLRGGRSVKAGDRVLIDGGGGSVGPFAIQVAKAAGAEVTGVDGAEKLDLMRSLGADLVLDHRVVDYTTTGERYDWILDVDSHHTVPQARRALRPHGVYVTLGGATPRLLAAMVVGPVASLALGKPMGLMLWWQPFRAEDVTTLVELIETGRLVPVIDRTMRLEAVVEALRLVDEGRARGKVIVTP